MFFLDWPFVVYIAVQGRLGSRTHDQHLSPLRQENTAGEEQGLSNAEQRAETTRPKPVSCYVMFNLVKLLNQVSPVFVLDQLRSVPQACAWGTDCTKFTCPYLPIFQHLSSAPGPVNFRPQTLLYIA